MRIAILTALALCACSDRRSPAKLVDIGGAAAAAQADIDNYAKMRAAEDRRRRALGLMTR